MTKLDTKMYAADALETFFNMGVYNPNEIAYTYDESIGLPPVTLDQMVERSEEIYRGFVHQKVYMQIDDAYIIKNELNGFFNQAYGFD
jgi:hypothetical protein